MRWLPLVALVLVACGSSNPPAPSQVALGDAENGQTVKVHAGDSVRVTLDSTSWTFAGSSDPSVLEQLGAQAVSPAPSGTCVAGQGCGVTAASFQAIKRGTATIDASRVSCGEARVCVGAEGKFEVTVVVV